MSYTHKETIRISRLTRHMRDITGERNGDIEAIAPHSQDIYYYQYRKPLTFTNWTFRCHRCGKDFVSRHSLIDEPTSRSCGCYKKDVGCKRGGTTTGDKLRGKPATRKGVRYPGITLIAKKHNIHASTLIHRLDRGMTLEEALGV